MGAINDVPALKEATKDKLAYMMTPNYQNYEAKGMTGEIMEESLRRDIREHVLRFAEGGCYAPFTWSVDDWWYEPMRDEIQKCRKEIGWSRPAGGNNDE
jgi:hypothetical protein